MQSEEDIVLIGGEFLAAELPKDKAWLLRYFRSDVLKKFAIYSITFRQLTKRVSLRYYCQLFMDHTGCSCSIPLLCRAAKKMRDLEEMVTKAENARDLNMLTKLKFGAYKLNKGHT